MKSFLVTLAVMALAIGGASGAHALVIQPGFDYGPSEGEFTWTIFPGIFPAPLDPGFTETISLDSIGQSPMCIERDLQQGNGDGSASSFIETEIVALDLVGTSANVGDVHLRVGAGNAIPVAIPTPGKIENVLTDPPHDSTPAGPEAFVSGDSFFDVFFEVDVSDVPGLTVYNKAPHTLSAHITELPPYGSQHTPPGTVQIYAMLDLGTGPQEVYIGTAGGTHTITPELSALTIWSLLGALGVTIRWYRRRKPA